MDLERIPVGHRNAMSRPSNPNDDRRLREQIEKAKIDTQYFRKKIITMIEKNPQKTFDQIVLDMFDLYNMQIKIILKDIPEIMKKP